MLSSVFAPFLLHALAWPPTGRVPVFAPSGSAGTALKIFRPAPGDEGFVQSRLRGSASPVSRGANPPPGANPAPPLAPFLLRSCFWAGTFMPRSCPVLARKIFSPAPGGDRGWCPAGDRVDISAKSLKPLGQPRFYKATTPQNARGGYLLDSGSPYRLWFRLGLGLGVQDLFQGNRLNCDSLLCQAEEKLATAF